MSIATTPVQIVPDRAKCTCPWSVWLDRISLVIVAAAVLGWVTVLRPVWASRPDLADRFLIPLTSAWLIYRAWPRILVMERLPTKWGLLPLVFGTGAFAVGWYVTVQVSGRPIVVWWLSAALILMILGSVLTLFGWRQAAILAFPVAFVLFSLPTPGRVYRPLQDKLQRFTTKAAEVTLPIMGVDVVRPDPKAFELTLKSGSLGVVEACSGVRSITALTAISVLVCYLRGFGFMRSALMVVLTLGVVAISNAVRVIVTGLLQEYLGRQFIQGWYHDALGIGAILIGLALIVGLSALMAPRRQIPTAPVADSPRHDFHRPVLSVLACGVLLATAGVCLWSEQFRLDHRVFIQLDQLPLVIGEWRGHDLPIDQSYHEELMCDQIVRRDYENEHGQVIQVWVMFWGSAATTAHMHHPDVCYPSGGWTVRDISKKVSPISVAGVADGLTVTVRHYFKPDQEHVLFFWTQHGSYVLPEGPEAPEYFSGHSWIFELFKCRKPIDQGARLSVLLGTTSRGSVEMGNRLMHGFAGELATQIYRLCPQLLPKKPHHQRP